MSKLSQLLLILQLVLSKPVDRANEGLQRITNGQICDIELFPFAVQYYNVMVDFRTTHCGGSLLTYQWVLSAAHCFYTDQPIHYSTVVAGTSLHHIRVHKSGGIVREVIQYVPHPDYLKGVRTIQRNDILLLKLESPFPKNNPRISTVQLPAPDFTSNSKRAVVMGWGRTNVQPIPPHLINAHPEYFHNVENISKPITEAVLVCVEIPVAQQHECQRNYPTKFKIWSTHLCGKPYHEKDACFGDSGGPLVVNRTIIGVVSEGFGCGQNAFGVYARVDKYFDFMKKHIGDLIVPNATDLGPLKRWNKQFSGKGTSNGMLHSKLNAVLMLVFFITMVLTCNCQT